MTAFVRIVPVLLLLACRTDHPRTPAGSGSGDGQGSSGGEASGSSGGADSGGGESGSADAGSSDSSGGSGGGHFDLPAPREINDGNFATASVCASCHANADGASAMRTAAGEAVGAYDLWQGTMMANAARDPVWWAAVRAEVAATPSAAAAIEAKCTRCHAPMAAIRTDLWDDVGLSLAALADDGDRGQLGLDGVACAACHQIGTGDLGTAASESGHPEITTNGTIYGPHAAPFAMPMMHFTGFTPVEAPHMDTSAVCSSCHTLDTDALDEGGAPTGAHYAEQSTYLEWRNSQYTTEGDDVAAAARSCQSCHMASYDADGNAIVTRIARNPNGGDFGMISARSPYHQHAFVGGNAWVPALLRDFADELRPRGTAAGFDAAIAWVVDQLAHGTARVTIDGATRQGDVLRIPVVVRNDAGHKFPSGYPARRAWLRVVVRDAEDAVVFRSGASDAQGRLLDQAGAVLPFEQLGGGFEPHHRVIDDGDAVQIYEVIMADGAGDPTFRLLRADHDAKDNRLLPAGWRSDGEALDRIAPVLGVADDDFVGGADTVRYDVAAPAAHGPYAVEVTLMYQPLSARHLAELLAHDAEEIRALEGMLAALDRSGLEVASATATLP
ncbi:MAG: cytochrome c family protein [Nannocystaceae bacterium]|nr:cytochrome c family protein [Nannocystaceae bacterium]